MKFETTMAESIYRSKYMIGTDAELIDPLKRIDTVITKYYPHLKGKAIEYGKKKWVGFAGGLYRSAMNPNKNVSAVNCTTLYSPEDNLESIAEAWYWWAKFAATGQGEGVDLSKLRPNGAKVHNSSDSSTGPISFMKTFDGILKEIAQNGRRGASLISLNISHPDILDFITVKDEEGVLETANISIKVTDDFMQSVVDDGEWIFKYENEYEKIEKKIKARELFHMIAEHAHKSGDPGLLFWDTSVHFSNSDVLGYPVENVNACSEQVLDGHNVCLLSSINLGKFHEYGMEGYVDLIHFMTFALDAFRQEEIKESRSPSDEQIRKMIEMPRIGIGVTGFADHLIRMGLEYGSPDSEIETAWIFGTLSAESYKASYDIAKNYHQKSFPMYNKEKYKRSPFVKMLLDEGWIDDRHLDYQAHVCKTTMAPTGSVSIIVGAGGSGIEPLFAKYYVRRERSTTGEWKEWFIFNDLVRQILTEKGLEVTKENADALDPALWVTAHSLDNKNKLELMKIIQKYVDSAVSVTYNLKKDATVEDIEDIYLTAWRNKAKGVTVYREGSKSGVLITEDNYDDNTSAITIIPVKEIHAEKRPDSLDCDIYEISVSKQKMIVLVGMLDDKPYEIFVTDNPGDIIELDKHKKGKIHKVKKGVYNLEVKNGTTEVLIENISKVFDQEFGAVTRMGSLALRHHIPIQFIVDVLLKTKQFVAFEKSAARVLKKYIQEDEKVLTSDKCPECGADLKYVEGCKTCSAMCGYSACG